MAGLSVGALDREVTIECLVAQGDAGYPTEKWDTLEHGVFMSKVDLRGSEKFLAGQIAANVDTKWELQWRDDMDPDCLDIPKTRRLVHKGRIFDITAAMMIGRQDGVRLLTVAGSWL